MNLNKPVSLCESTLNYPKNTWWTFVCKVDPLFVHYTDFFLKWFFMKSFFSHWIIVGSRPGFWEKKRSKQNLWGFKGEMLTFYFPKSIPWWVKRIWTLLFFWLFRYFCTWWVLPYQLEKSSKLLFKSSGWYMGYAFISGTLSTWHITVVTWPQSF